jgi:hypothetical protein
VAIVIAEDEALLAELHARSSADQVDILEGRAIIDAGEFEGRLSIRFTGELSTAETIDPMMLRPTRVALANMTACETLEQKAEHNRPARDQNRMLLVFDHIGSVYQGVADYEALHPMMPLALDQ